MKLLTILTVAVFLVAVIVFSTAYACWCSADAYARVGKWWRLLGNRHLS